LFTFVPATYPSIEHTIGIRSEFTLPSFEVSPKDVAAIFEDNVKISYVATFIGEVEARKLKVPALSKWIDAVNQTSMELGS